MLLLLLLRRKLNSVGIASSSWSSSHVAVAREWAPIEGISIVKPISATRLQPLVVMMAVIAAVCCTPRPAKVVVHVAGIFSAVFVIVVVVAVVRPLWKEALSLTLGDEPASCSQQEEDCERAELE